MFYCCMLVLLLFVGLKVYILLLFVRWNVYVLLYVLQRRMF